MSSLPVLFIALLVSTSGCDGDNPDEQDTEAQDTDAEDTEAEDTEAEDTEAQDTDAEDTEAEDTDAQECAQAGEIADIECCEGLVPSIPDNEGEDAVCEEPAECAGVGEDMGEVGCCEGLLGDFTGTCYPCVPLGQMRDVDGPGCCEGLTTVGLDDLTCVEEE